MEHFKVFSVKAQLVCLICIISQAPIKGNSVQGTLPDLATLFKIVQAFIGPFVDSVGDSSATELRTLEEESVAKVIKKKIEELKPFLQDNDEIKLRKDDEDNNLTLEGSEETTIIEFVRNDKLKQKDNLRNKENKEKETTLKSKVDKYKVTRRKIKELLRSEKVSKKTQGLVINTLDEMMSKLLENKCTLNSENVNQIQKKTDNTVPTVTDWNEGLNEIKKYLILRSGNNSTEVFPGVKLFLMIEKIYEFLTQVSKDADELRDYKLNCKFVKQNTKRTKNKENTVLRSGKKTSNTIKKHKCEHFQICSQELSNFMANLFIKLNDTAVSNLRNYAAMFARDVNTEDSQEIEHVVTVINKTSDLAEHKITTTFKKQTNDFKLNADKDEDANYYALKYYIKDNIGSAKTFIKEELNSPQSSLQLTVRNDISVNLDVDLDNLQRDLKSRICPTFSTCNSKQVERRYGYSGDVRFPNKNSVYVKVQVSLDDEIKNSIARPRALYNKYKETGSKNLKNIYHNSVKKIYHNSKESKSLKKIYHNSKESKSLKKIYHNSKESKSLKNIYHNSLKNIYHNSKESKLQYRKFKDDTKGSDENTQLKATRTTISSSNTTGITTIKGTVSVTTTASTTTTVATKVDSAENNTDTFILK
ncbi:hypothetical protein ABMA27_004768 [Loxostege sticticalis]|uniref:Uncharacterized protein n=1 Tax=Loxostege sticticalis TaxID=481309 RepID=A0ABR3HKW9_LOXSC